MIYRDIKEFSINSIFLSTKHNTNQSNQQQNDFNEGIQCLFQNF